MQFKYIVGVTGGKGGVGKSNIAVNLGTSLVDIGYKPLIVDADINLGNVELLLGVRSKQTIYELINGSCGIDEVIVNTDKGMQILPAGIAKEKAAELSSLDLLTIINSIEQSKYNNDIVIVDTSAGVNQTVLNMLSLCKEVIVVVCNEPTSIMDAYTLMKTMSGVLGRVRFSFVANMVSSEQEAKNLYQNLVKVTDNHLDVEVKYLGHVLNDSSVVKAIRKQTPYVDLFPDSLASRCVKDLAAKIMQKIESRDNSSILRVS